MGKPGISRKNLKAKPVYTHRFNLGEGATLFSSNRSFGLKELRGRIINFGISKVKIPGKDNKTWILTGKIIYNTEEKIIEARNGVLILETSRNSREKTVILNKTLRISLKDPAGYQVISE